MEGERRTWIAKRCIRGIGEKEVSGGKEAQFAVCLDSAIKQSRGGSGPMTARRKERENWESGWIEWVIEWGCWKQELGWCIYGRTESKEPRNCWAGCRFVIFICWFLGSQQCLSKYASTGLQFLHPCLSISTFSVFLTSAQFPFDILPLFFSGPPFCYTVTQH